MKADSDGGSGEDQDGFGNKVLSLTDQPPFCCSSHHFKTYYLLTEKRQQIQNVTTVQERVKGNV